MSTIPILYEDDKKMKYVQALALLIILAFVITSVPEVTAQSPVILGIEGHAHAPNGSLLFFLIDGGRVADLDCIWDPTSNVDITREFDVSAWLPDNDGEYKIELWAEDLIGMFGDFEVDRVYLKIGNDEYAPTSATETETGALYDIQDSDDWRWWLPVEYPGLYNFIEMKFDFDGPVTSTVVASPNPASVNGPISITATVDDTMTGGTPIASAEYSFDAAFTSPLPMGAQDGALDQVTEAVTATIPADTLSPGVYTIYVRGTDSAGNVGVEAEAVIPLVVYDPTGGFVTGGGWIDSPPGAYYEAGVPTDLAGKASFGFVSKYKNGASTPSGQTEFVFKTAELNFHSDSYEWLVIAGPRAMYKGTGTVNGAGGYGFMVSAIDGEVNGGGGIDKFRIKIWAIGGDIVYDNQPGDTDDAAVTTELGGGRIVIHKA